MKSSMKMLLIALVALGLAVPGCKKKKEDKQDEKTETAAQTNGETNNEEADEKEAETNGAEEEDAGTAELDEDMFIKANYEVTCVQAKIEDPAKIKKIKTEVYARYGFDEETYKKAEKQFGEKENVKTAVKTKMEDCTKEAAEGFAKAGDEGKEEDKEEKAEGDGDKKPKKTGPAKTGRLTSNTISVMGFDGAKFSLSVSDEYKVTGYFKGKREGKGFNIPVRGTVSKSGQVNAQGERGQTNVKVSGRLTAAGLDGTATGKIAGKNYKVKFKAK